jgi:hypothetical protein
MLVAEIAHKLPIIFDNEADAVAQLNRDSA